jgi:hypothetical protein
MRSRRKSPCGIPPASWASFGQFTNMNNVFPTPEQLALEAREALSRRPAMTPQEHFTWMVRKGMINARGEMTRLIGGSAEPEPEYETWTPEENGHTRKQRAR